MSTIERSFLSADTATSMPMGLLWLETRSISSGTSRKVAYTSVPNIGALAGIGSSCVTTKSSTASTISGRATGNGATSAKESMAAATAVFCSSEVYTTLLRVFVD